MTSLSLSGPPRPSEDEGRKTNTCKNENFSLCFLLNIQETLRGFFPYRSIWNVGSGSPTKCTLTPLRTDTLGRSTQSFKCRVVTAVFSPPPHRAPESQRKGDVRSCTQCLVLTHSYHLKDSLAQKQ